MKSERAPHKSGLDQVRRNGMIGRRSAVDLLNERAGRASRTANESIRRLVVARASPAKERHRDGLRGARSIWLGIWKPRKQLAIAARKKGCERAVHQEGRCSSRARWSAPTLG